MKLRSYRESDLEQLTEIHRKQNFKYPMPDLNDPAFALGCVAEDEQGEIAMALFGKVTMECFLFADRESGTPVEKWQSFIGLHQRVQRDAKELGFHEAQIWIPPELTGSNTERDSPWLRRLKRIGWREDKWRNLTFPLR